MSNFRNSYYIYKKLNNIPVASCQMFHSKVLKIALLHQMLGLTLCCPEVKFKPVITKFQCSLKRDECFWTNNPLSGFITEVKIKQVYITKFNCSLKRGECFWKNNALSGFII